MKHFFLVIFIALLLSGCQHEASSKDIAKINGYWEIEKVILPGGKAKDYKVNETIDYFKIDNNSGIRKKVTPQFDGKYIDYGTSEKIDIAAKGDQIWLVYNSGYASWKEEIITVTDSELVLRDKGNIEYHYKKPVPYSAK